MPGTLARILSPRPSISTAISAIDELGIAQLGFIVMILDARGTPERSKAFQDVVYGNIGLHEIPDHVSALHQLAAQPLIRR